MLGGNLITANTTAWTGAVEIGEGAGAAGEAGEDQP